MNILSSHFSWAVDFFDMGLREPPSNYTFTDCHDYLMIVDLEIDQDEDYW